MTILIFLTEMLAYSLAAAHLRLPHDKLAQSFMVSETRLEIWRAGGPLIPFVPRIYLAISHGKCFHVLSTTVIASHIASGL
jgi:hypothetical protein